MARYATQDRRTSKGESLSAVDVLQWLTRVAFIGLAVVAVVEVRRRGTVADRWMAATTSSLALVVVASLVIPEDRDGWVDEVSIRALVAVLALFPYFLFRFASAFDARGRMPHWVAVSLTASLIVFSLFVDLPEEGEDRTALVTAWTAHFLLVWTVLSMVVARRLWRGGRDQPPVARRRMRLLSIAALVFAATLVISGTAGGDDNDSVTAAVQAGSFAAAVLFYIAYAPPAVVRTWWRRREAEALRRAELDLLATTTPDQVTELLLPRAAALLGARDAKVVPDDSEAAEPAEGADDALRIPLRTGTLVLDVSPYAPVFGEEELGLLRSLAVVADLAIERNRLLTSERDARAEAERLSGDLEQFAYATSHDLQEPLRLMSGFADLLDRRYGDQLDDQGRELVDAIGRASRRSQELIRDLLELSRLGRQEMELARTNFAEAVDEALGNLAPLIEETGASVDVDPLPEAEFDRRLMGLVFQNLIGNAIKYARPGEPPRVRVAGRRVNGFVEVAVTDNGQGIQPEHYERIFAPFERLQGTEDGPAGTGIGLAIVKKAVELHAGSVRVGPGPDGGSTFTVTVPVTGEPPDDAEHASAAA